MRTRPFPVAYGIAREYLELRRLARSTGPGRTHAELKCRGGMRALASLASAIGLVSPGSARFESLAREVVEELPIAPGPEWLSDAAEALTAKIEADA